MSLDSHEPEKDMTDWAIKRVNRLLKNYRRDLMTFDEWRNGVFDQLGHDFAEREVDLEQVFNEIPFPLFHFPLFFFGN